LAHSGNLKELSGDPDGAIKDYQDKLAMLRAVLPRDPHLEWPERIANDLDEIGGLKVTVRDIDGARKAYTEAVEAWRVARANDWANGFMRGMEMRRGGWAGLMDDEDRAGSLVPILALAHEHDPDPEMRPYREPISAEMRETLIVGAAAGVLAI
jgi:hypothetical protein